MIDYNVPSGAFTTIRLLDCTLGNVSGALETSDDSENDPALTDVSELYVD